MIFNLLCAPCFAAMGAIKREMNNGKWTAFAIGYMCALAYCSALVVYQLGGLITGEVGFNFSPSWLLSSWCFIYLMVTSQQVCERQRSQDRRFQDQVKNFSKRAERSALL